MDINQRKVMPKGALAIVLHTCEFPRRQHLGQTHTKQAIKVLGARDDVGVLDYSYGGAEQWVFPLSPAGDYDKLAPLVEAAAPGDMPSFSTIMQIGYDGLKATTPRQAHDHHLRRRSAPRRPSCCRSSSTADQRSMCAVFPHGGVDPGTMKAVPRPPDAAITSRRIPIACHRSSSRRRRPSSASRIQNLVFTPKAQFPCRDEGHRRHAAAEGLH